MRWLGALWLATLIWVGPALAQELCLGPDVGQRLMDRMESLASSDLVIDSMAVSKARIDLAVRRGQTTYKYVGNRGDGRPLTFSPATGEQGHADIDRLLEQSVAALDGTIWSPCGGAGEPADEPRPEGAGSVHDLSDLPEDACRPVPGHYCYDDYWTLPPRLGFAGTLVIYLVHLGAALALLLAGIVFLARARRARQRP